MDQNFKKMYFNTGKYNNKKKQFLKVIIIINL